MDTSTRDADTRISRAAFALPAPDAPLALFALLGAPFAWWSDAMLGFCGALADVTVSAMTYPFELHGLGVAAAQGQGRAAEWWRSTMPS